MRLPRILVIDDQFGPVGDARRDLCEMYGLKDVSGEDPAPEEIEHPIAEAVFCSGQTRDGDHTRNDVAVALSAVRSGWPFGDGMRLALVLLDLRYVSGTRGRNGVPAGSAGDETFGLEILRQLRHEYPDLPVVVLSSMDREAVIEDCRKLGAADFIQRHGTSDGMAPREVLAAKLREYGLLEDPRGAIVGRSVGLLQAMAAARRAATGTGNILLLGESGTGKELMARYVHDQSPKARGPYKIFHAFGTAEPLQEDLLFGHLKGAFTDAKTDRAGLFELADAGTLFIDEIGEVPGTLQNKLLRPIESRRVTRQGEDLERAVDIQLVLATNKALDEYTVTGRFKFDLLNRIRAYPITIPPLRERREDIPLLAEHLLEYLCREHNARWPRAIHPAAMEKLTGHEWREGNIREMRNVLERVVKDNKDAEIVVAGDIRFDTLPSASARVVNQTGTANPPVTAPVAGDALDNLRQVSVAADYERLRGSWPIVQREIAQLLAQYLSAAIEATRRRKADGAADKEINITGAVSCLLGRQVPTIKAADFVKRVLQFDEEATHAVCSAHPELEQALRQALRMRPVRSKTSGRTREKGR